MSVEENSSEDALIEDDHRETKMGFGPGQFPVYVKLMWLCFFVGFIFYTLTYVVPELRLWLGQ